MNLLRPYRAGKTDAAAMMAVTVEISSYEIKKAISAILNKGIKKEEIYRAMVEDHIENTLRDNGLDGLQNFENHIERGEPNPEFDWEGGLVWDVFADHFGDFIIPEE